MVARRTSRNDLGLFGEAVRETVQASLYHSTDREVVAERVLKQVVLICADLLGKYTTIRTLDGVRHELTAGRLDRNLGKEEW